MPLSISERGPIITLIAQDVDQVYSFLKEKGVSLLGRPEENPTFKIYHFFLKDPNGYLVEIQRFLD